MDSRIQSFIWNLLILDIWKKEKKKGGNYQIHKKYFEIMFQHQKLSELE